VAAGDTDHIFRLCHSVASGRSHRHHLLSLCLALVLFVLPHQFVRISLAIFSGISPSTVVTVSTTMSGIFQDLQGRHLVPCLSGFPRLPYFVLLGVHGPITCTNNSVTVGSLGLEPGCHLILYFPTLGGASKLCSLESNPFAYTTLF
jgi:hypothetical protein